MNKLYIAAPFGALAFILATIVSLGVRAQDNADSASIILNQLCSAASQENPMVVCDIGSGFSLPWETGAVEFMPSLLGFEDPNSSVVLASTYERYRATDGALIAALSLFNPSAVENASVGRFIGVDRNNISADVIEAIQAGFSAGAVQIAVSGNSGMNTANSYVAFQNSDVRNQEVSDGILAAILQGSWLDEGSEVGIVAASDWYESTGNSVGLELNQTTRLLSWDPATSFSATTEGVWGE